MADVLIVCVREDEPQAKALADMFEAAGFSIGGAPSSDAALRSSGAGVVVWSQASIRSRPFLDAAQRVINADKAVVASLIEPPPPSSIGSSPAFDLSHWDGDPNDASLDPLFFAVDRMVNAARAGVGAAQREADYEPPARNAPIRAEPPPRREPSYRAPPAEPAPTYRVPPSTDPLGSEAEHWRAIRDSRNASDFMDYLARYGPEGAFSEVAELRLKQLTGGGGAAPASRPAVRAPAARSEPQRREVALPPTQRRAESTRRPPIERDYTRDLRDPPKGEGGALRAFVLIAILGAAALAGGLYFGGGLGNPEPSAPAAVESATAPYSEDLGVEFGGLEEAPSVPLSQAATSQAERQPVARPQRQDQPPRTPEREPSRQTQPATTQPSASNVASTTPSNTGGGPVSLSPDSANQAATPVPLTPLNPDAAPVRTANVEPTITGSATPPRAAPGTVVWTQRPSSRRISDVYPQRALRDGMGGRVVLDCRVLGNLSVSCSIASETPSGAGFGAAAMSVAGSYRARATLSDGSSAVGSTTRIAVNFQAPQQ